MVSERWYQPPSTEGANERRAMERQVFIAASGWRADDLQKTRINPILTTGCRSLFAEH